MKQYFYSGQIVYVMKTCILFIHYVILIICTSVYVCNTGYVLFCSGYVQNNTVILFNNLFYILVPLNSCFIGMKIKKT